MSPAAEDLEAIRQLKARYCRLLDTKDWDGWRDVFTEDVVAVVDNAVSTGGADGQPGPAWEGVDVFVPSVRSAVENCVTVHHVHSPEIELTSETTATGIWAMEDTVESPDGWALYGAGHYHETYAKQDGRWRIKSNHLTRTRLKLVTS
ncbi:nuclear transport factor 2 family protein [Mycobacterium sp.]|uniref:nuclear transport factor 2 family protein n=1 Tax=Mycobacterium sp. TaxID=1785 RepID=UPI002CA53BD8|nr:nuclear transport factor 2 family protein [Mycobacterium sp.]HME49506.1 nuclear transport factor 2 family protein [Mycobacterium sp.]